MPDLSDVRYAFRLWRRHPTLVIVAGLSLGLGVGATTTMYSLVNRVAFYELGFENVDRLVVLTNTNTANPDNEQPPTYEIVKALQDRNGSFEAFGLFQPFGAPVTLAGTEETERVEQMPVDVNGLRIAGIPPLMGRIFRPEDFDDLVKQKEARGIVISYETWQERLGGAPDVIGKTIRVDGEPRHIIGVMPEDFALMPWAEDIAFWIANDLRKIPVARWMFAIGRLKPGVTLAAAQAEATAVSQQVLKARGEKAENTSARVVPLHEAYFGGARRGLSFILGAVSFVLLIGCANVANLLLAAGAARQKELALRAAAGAGRRRLIGQLLTENVLLSLVGCVIGLAFAFWGVRLHALIVPNEFPELIRHIPVDARVLAFALGISVASSLVFGLIPAIRASRVDLNEVLKEGGRSGSSGRRRGRNALLVAEVSLSMVLLVGAGLMLRGFLNEQSELPGFNTERLLTTDILLGGKKYFEKTPDDLNRVTEQSEVFYDRLLERVRALPGVRRAGIVSRLPFNVYQHPFAIIGKPAPQPGSEPRADLNEVDSQLFDTLSLRVLRGRGIKESDVISSGWVVVINKTFAERHFPGEDPIGKAVRVSVGWGGQPGTVVEPQAREIVGIVSDVKYPSFFTTTPAAMYIPFRQHLQHYGAEDQWLHTRKVLAVRTAGDPMLLVPAIQNAVKEVDPDQAAHEFMTMEQRVASSPSVTNSRFFASLFTAFGTLAILLAMVGVYGVMSWVVGQRTTEFGIRMALGARARDVVQMLLGQSLRPILIGVVLGALGGVGLGRLFNNMFWEMTGADPVVLGCISALMVAAALVAAWAPLRRVTRLDPQHALRYE
jgi:putative ABC transport system permease protein